jgi:molybdate transport system substrate-binding protein
VTVLVAASLADATQEVGDAFERLMKDQGRVKVTISSGPSNGLAQQIISGAPADLFASASTKWAAALVAEGLVAKQHDLLSNRLVLVVPRGNPAQISGPMDLLSERVQRIVIADANVPAGTYAQQALETLELFRPLEETGRVVRGSDVRVTLAYVERGEVEAGIVYATDAKIAEHVEIVTELDPMSYESIIYPVVLLKDSEANAAAHEFFDFLQGPESTTIFEEHGFTVLPAAAPVTDGA